MYGKKRVTIEKGGQIVINGGKSYIPVGRYFIVDGLIVGKLRKVENPFETILDEKNSVDFKFTKVSELREYVKKIYVNELV